MKRAEFIKIFADTVAVGRRKKHPDIRLSEEIFARIDTEAKAASLWRKHAAFYRARTAEQFKAELCEGEGSNGE